MKPSDCRDQQDANALNEQGIAINEWSLNVHPATVSIRHKHYGEVRMPMTIFKHFAKWYLEDQAEDWKWAQASGLYKDYKKL